MSIGQFSHRKQYKSKLSEGGGGVEENGKKIKVRKILQNNTLHLAYL